MAGTDVPSLLVNSEAAGTDVPSLLVNSEVIAMEIDKDITADIDQFLDEQEIAARQLKSIQRWINTR